MTWEYFIGLSRSKDGESAPIRNHSISPDPFPRGGVGSGHETRGKSEEGSEKYSQNEHDHSQQWLVSMEHAVSESDLLCSS